MRFHGFTFAPVVIETFRSLVRSLLLVLVVTFVGCSDTSSTDPDMGEDLGDVGADMGACPIEDCANAVFVSAAAGDDENSGSFSAPYHTIGHALLAANSRTVHVEAGIYSEKLTLDKEATLIGGYAAGFVERLADQRSTLRGAEPADIKAITGPTRIDGFAFEATDSPESSIALRVLDSSDVRLSNVDLLSGRGGLGADGAAGESGASGDAGTTGQPGCEDGTGSCSVCSRPNPGLGGTSACGALGGDGGSPGHDSISGEVAQAGRDASGTEVTPPGTGGVTDQAGGDGSDGMDQPRAADGQGGTEFGTFDSAYIPADGSPGSTGLQGIGGGGGGGGGGHDGGIFCDEYGGAGGGGGGGGCAGLPGAPGSGGGASLGMLVQSSSVLLENVRFVTSPGGEGGRGGEGGAGGDGGTPGLGGAGAADSGAGGAGGRGGKGGGGGHGGGGGGGPSLGIVCTGASNIEMSGVTYQIASGGAGGASSGNSGMLGLSAETHGCP